MAGRVAVLSFMRRALWVVGGLALLLTAGYFIAGALVRKKIETALHALPPGLTITYTSLHLRLLSGAVSLDDLCARWKGQSVTIKELNVDGIGYAALLHHRLRVRKIRLKDCSVDADEQLMKEKMDLPEMALPFTAVSIGAVEVEAIRVAMGKGRLQLDGSQSRTRAE